MRYKLAASFEEGAGMSIEITGAAGVWAGFPAITCSAQNVSNVRLSENRELR